MNRQPPTPPDFTVTYDEPATCGVSDRLQRRIRLQFAAVLAGAAIVLSVAVAVVRAMR